MLFQIQGGLWDAVGVVGVDVDVVEAVKYVALLSNFWDSWMRRHLCCRENWPLMLMDIKVVLVFYFSV